MLIVTVITLHFIFDWILQPRRVARDKGRGSEKAWVALWLHMLLNIVPFSFVLWLVLVLADYEIVDALGITILNGISHFLIDALLPKGKDERTMINWTAVDQILHINILILLMEFV